MIPHRDLDAEYEAEQIECPECSRPTSPADLCEDPDPACPSCCERRHYEPDADRFREWVREGWSA